MTVHAHAKSAIAVYSRGLSTNQYLAKITEMPMQMAPFIVLILLWFVPKIDPRQQIYIAWTATANQPN